MTPQDLYAAVAKQLEAAAFDAMQAEQPQHKATTNERIAFKLGSWTPREFAQWVVYAAGKFAVPVAW